MDLSAWRGWLSLLPLAISLSPLLTRTHICSSVSFLPSDLSASLYSLLNPVAPVQRQPAPCLAGSHLRTRGSRHMALQQLPDETRLRVQLPDETRTECRCLSAPCSIKNSTEHLPVSAPLRVAPYLCCSSRCGACRESEARAAAVMDLRSAGGRGQRAEGREQGGGQARMAGSWIIADARRGDGGVTEGREEGTGGTRERKRRAGDPLTGGPRARWSVRVEQDGD